MVARGCGTDRSGVRLARDPRSLIGATVPRSPPPDRDKDNGKAASESLHPDEGKDSSASDLNIALLTVTRPVLRVSGEPAPLDARALDVVLALVDAAGP